MKLESTLFAIVLGACAIIGLLFLVEPHESAAGQPHRRVANMNVGGDGPARHNGWPLVVGWLYGVLQIAFYVGSVLFAVRHRKGQLGLVLAAGLLYIAVFAMMFTSYVQYLRNPRAELILSFPPPTAWMIYGLWSVPFLFTILYMAKFRTWIFSEEDQKQFEQILEKRKHREQLAEA